MSEKGVRKGEKEGGREMKREGEGGRERRREGEGGRLLTYNFQAYSFS